MDLWVYNNGILRLLLRIIKVLWTCPGSCGRSKNFKSVWKSKKHVLPFRPKGEVSNIHSVFLRSLFRKSRSKWKNLLLRNALQHFNLKMRKQLRI